MSLTPQQKQALDQLVFTEKNFVGRDKLWYLARSRYPHLKITQNGVMNYLKTSETHQLFHPKRKRKTIKSTIVKKPFDIVAIDLIDFSTWEIKNMKWILNAMDLFTKKGYVEALPFKDSDNVIAGMTKILSRMPMTPKTIRSDNDSAFQTLEWKTFMTENNIKHIFSNPNAPQSNGAIEKRNGVLQQQLKMIRTQDKNRNWVDYLQQVNNNMNSQYHSTIKMSPNDARIGLEI